MSLSQVPQSTTTPSMEETTSFSEAEGGFSEAMSTTMLPASATRLNRLTEAKKPSDDELEEFFSSAERKLHKQVSKKYNFNFEKEEPLEGRYEWVKMKLAREWSSGKETDPNK